MGLADQTLPVLATEFIRTPRINDSDGRDHHNKAFACLLVGAEIRMGRRMRDTLTATTSRGRQGRQQSAPCSPTSRPRGCWKTLVVLGTHFARKPRINDNDGWDPIDNASKCLRIEAGIEGGEAKGDTHSDDFEGTYSTQRPKGLLDQTLVALGIEFGHTSRIIDNDGREYHDDVVACLLAGANVPDHQDVLLRGDRVHSGWMLTEGNTPAHWPARLHASDPWIRRGHL